MPGPTPEVGLLSACCRDCRAKLVMQGPERSTPAAWRKAMDDFLAELRRLGWGWSGGFRYCGECLAKVGRKAG